MVISVCPSNAVLKLTYILSFAGLGKIFISLFSFLDSEIPVVTFASNTAVVESAGTVIFKEFRMTVIVFFFKALSVCDLNVSVAGKADNSKVE